jgi:hypothetical protein
LIAHSHYGFAFSASFPLNIDADLPIITIFALFIGGAVQISVFSQQGSSNPTFQRQVFRSLPAAVSTADQIEQPSGLAAIASTYGLSEVSLQSDQVTWGYRQNGSLALHATSSINLTARRQDVAVEMSLSADALGVKLPSSLFQNGPLEFNLSYQFKTAQVSTRTQARIVKTTRTPEEILRSLSKALGEALGKGGDKSVSVVFDEEAIKSLMGDAEMSKAIGALLSLIMVINAMAAQNQAKDHCAITISGKGEPYLDVATQTSANVAETNIQIHVVINPPSVGQNTES